MSNVNSLRLSPSNLPTAVMPLSTSKRPRVAPKQILQTQTQTVIAYVTKAPSGVRVRLKVGDKYWEEWRSGVWGGAVPSQLGVWTGACPQKKKSILC